MTRWQYRVVTFPAAALEKELNRLGAEQWEVVATQFDRLDIRPSVGVHHVETVQVTAILKRPIITSSKATRKR